MAGKFYIRAAMQNTRKQARERFARQVTGLWTFRAFLLLKLPIALFSGLRVRQLTAESCTVSIPFKWLTQNPFRSVYFASQAMAAEMSTGILGLMALQGCDPTVSMLVTKLEAAFTKKATGRVYFTCGDGRAIFDAVEKTMVTGEGVTVRCTSVGRMGDGTEVSRFLVEWSFKRKR